MTRKGRLTLSGIAPMTRVSLALKRRIGTFTSGSRRSVIQVSIGSASAQLMALVSLPVLTRLFSPDAFGVLSVILAVVPILSMIVSLRLDLAIPSALSKGEAEAIARLALGVSVALSVLAGSLLWIPAASTWSVALDSTYLPWTLALSFLTAAFSILSALYIWRGEFRAIAWRSFWQGLAGVISSIAAGLLGFLTTGLIIGQTIARVVAVSLMLGVVFRRPGGDDGVTTSLRRLWRYPVQFMPAGLLNTIGGQLPLLLVAASFGARDAGLLGVSQRILAVPAALVGLSIGQVFLGRIAQIRVASLSNQRKAATGALRVLIPIGVAITLGSFLIAPLLEWGLGEGWGGVGGFIQASALVSGGSFIAAPMQLILVANKEGLQNLLLDGSRVGLVSLAAVGAYVFESTALQTVWYMAVAQALNYLLTIRLGLSSANRWDRRLQSPV